MHMMYDADEYELTHDYTACRSCAGDMTKCNGMCTGRVSVGYRRRDPAEVFAIKAARERSREDAVLAEAALIHARRASEQAAT